MKRQLGENLKTKCSDSSLSFRLSSLQSRPGLRRQRVTFSPSQEPPRGEGVGGAGRDRWEGGWVAGSASWVRGRLSDLWTEDAARLGGPGSERARLVGPEGLRPPEGVVPAALGASARC